MKKNIKKRNLLFKTLFVTIVLLMSTSLVFVAAEEHNEYCQIVKTYVFPTPQIKQVIVENQMYDRIYRSGSPTNREA